MEGVPQVSSIKATNIFLITLVLLVEETIQAGTNENNTTAKKKNNEILWWQIIIISVLCFLVVIVIIIIFVLIIKLRGGNNKIKDSESPYDKTLSEDYKSKIMDEKPKTPERSKTPFEIKASTASIKYSQPARENLQSAGLANRVAMPEVETNDPAPEVGSSTVSPSDTYWEEKTSNGNEKKQKKKKKKKKKKVQKVQRSDSNMDEARKIYGIGR